MQNEGRLQGRENRRKGATPHTPWLFSRFLPLSAAALSLSDTRAAAVDATLQWRAWRERQRAEKDTVHGVNATRTGPFRNNIQCLSLPLCPFLACAQP